MLFRSGRRGPVSYPEIVLAPLGDSGQLQNNSQPTNHLAVDSIAIQYIIYIIIFLIRLICNAYLLYLQRVNPDDLRQFRRYAGNAGWRQKRGRRTPGSKPA